MAAPVPPTAAADPPPPRRPRPRDGNEVTLLQSGAEYFPALVEAIDGARREVLLETYIFAADDSAMRVATALAGAAARGVAVRVLVDGYGTRTLAPGIERLLLEAGVRLLTYSPMPRLVGFDRERLRRLHSKQACVDAQVAFVGGINLLDDLWDPNHGVLEHPRLDYAVRLRGPIVADVHAAMSRLWRHVALGRLPRLADRFRSATRSAVHAGTAVGAAVRAGVGAASGRRRRGTGAAVPAAAADAAPDAARPPDVAVGVRATLLLRDNLTHRRTIERAYLKAIGGARREVLIANAYFFPGRRFRRALRMAARRGVRVRLLLQGRPEYVLPHLAGQALYDGLLGAGVEIVEYHRSFLHAKVAVVDDWATVGSSNIDPFSLLLARESNVVVLDAGFAARLRERLLESMAEGGRAVDHDDHARRPWTQRLYGWGATRLLRLGVMMTGSGRRY